MAKTYRIAAISGSLRRGSYNTAALRAAKKLQPQSIDLDVITLEDVPMFNQDVEDQGWPERVAQLRDRVERADGAIFATPEYNYSITGALKNAIDWLSRPTGEGPIVNKPVAIIGASASTIGTARAQAHLRQIVYYNAMPLLTSAEVLISRAGDKFDDDGRLTDDGTREFLAQMLQEFAAWVHLINSR